MKTNLISQAVRYAMLAGVSAAVAAPAAFAQVADPAGTSAQNQNQNQSSQNVNLKKVMVTGSAIPRTSVETAAPITIITAKQIKESGFTTVAAVLRSIAADNSGTLPTSFEDAFAQGASGIALRGLTVNSTLVLIDGRRTADYPFADDGIRSFTDLNSIPMNAVERIEVLKDGASSLYGADAIAGVVNIILYPSYNGSEATAEVGTSQQGGGTKTHVTFITGTGNLDQDKYNAYLSFEYQKNDPIWLRDRGFPYNTTDLTSLGGTNASPGGPAELGFAGSNYAVVMPATLSTPSDLLTGQPVPGSLWQPLRPCGADSTPITVPGVGSSCAQDFAKLYGQVQPESTHYGLDGRITLNLTDTTQAYLNVSYDQVRNEDQTNPPEQIQVPFPTNTGNIALPPTLLNGQLNPNDPFAAQGEYALISTALAGLPGADDTTTTTHNLRVVADLNGALNENWNYDAALTLNHIWLNYNNFGLVVYSQLINDINTGAYSFVNPASNSQAVLDALAPPVNETPTSDMDSLDFGVNGDVGNLPGGPLGLAFGTQWRYEAQYSPQLNPGNTLQGIAAFQSIGHHNVAALYGELDAPLLPSFNVDVSAREDHYSDFGGAFSPKLGIKWTPIQQLAFRGTYSRGFRAPSFSENGSSSVIGFIPDYVLPASFIAAHQSDNYVQPFSLGEYTVGNSAIKPERARNYTLGLVFQPLSSLSGTLDYYNILKTNVIVGEAYQTVLSAYFAGQPLPSGSYVTPGLPDPEFPTLQPRPAVVGSPYTNESELRTSGVDLALRETLDFDSGLNWTSEFHVTKIISWCEVSSPGQPCVSMVGTQGPFNLSSGAGTPQYRANWSNSFTFGPATITGTFFYVSHMYMSAPDIGVNGNPYACFSINANTGLNIPPNCTVPSFTYFNLTGAYRLGDGWTLTAGVLNAFGREPPFDPIDYAGVNFNPTYHEAGIIGRFYQLGVRVKF